MASETVINGVVLSHPDRIYWPQAGLTKRDLADYYDRVAPLMLPYVLGRPVSMVRCPGGLAELPAGVRRGDRRVDACFFHKHPAADFPGPFQRVLITESGGPAPYLVITEPGSLTALAQMGVLEIHVWGSSLPDLERPDMLVFDLDPDETVAWQTLSAGALLVRQTLAARGLESFVKTTGGKGLHVVTPIRPSGNWAQVHSFCKGVADEVAGEAPDTFTATMSKARRTGKIYVDYVRNTRGSTSVAPYSTRAREAATVAFPLGWEELEAAERPQAHTLATLAERLARLDRDPWSNYPQTAGKQSLPV
jgi:bifunctional non-homologous end joining protein LigD